MGKELAQLEKEKIMVTEQLSSASQPFEKLEQLSKRIGEISREIDEKELRWLELSEIAS